MKTKTPLSTARVLGRIIKDSFAIAHWLLLATLFSIFSALLAMKAPDLLGDLTNDIYLTVNIGSALDMNAFGKDVIVLVMVYLASALLGALTTTIMNYSVSSFITCRIRIRMSEKIAKMSMKTIDTTPNGEIISRMTSDVSIMGFSR